MIQKNLLIKQRVRKIKGSFAWLPHAFLRDGFFCSLTHHELLLYLFLVLAADRHGLSYYSFDRICSLLNIITEEYILAKNSLIDKNLIAFDGYLFQVLSLPKNPVTTRKQPITTIEEMEKRDPATVRQLILKSLSNEE